MIREKGVPELVPEFESTTALIRQGEPPSRNNGIVRREESMVPPIEVVEKPPQYLPAPLPDAPTSFRLNTVSEIEPCRENEAVVSLLAEIAIKVVALQRMDLMTLQGLRGMDAARCRNLCIHAADGLSSFEILLSAVS